MCAGGATNRSQSQFMSIYLKKQTAVRATWQKNEQKKQTDSVKVIKESAAFSEMMNEVSE